MQRLSICLFGEGRLDGGPRPGQLRAAPGVKAMLGYLVLNGARAHRRDHLATLFWPNADDRTARNRLSSVLWRLRHLLEPEGVPGGTYVIAPRGGPVAFNDACDHWLDVVAFREAATGVVDVERDELCAESVAAFEDAATAYCDDLLAGTDMAWLVIERERLSNLLLRASRRVMGWYEDNGDLERAVDAGERLVAHDPLREDVHRALIRLHGRLGDRGGARQQFEACRSLLRAELGVTPLPETVAAAARAVEAPDTPVTAPARGLATSDAAATAGPADSAGTVDELRAALATAARSLDLAAADLVEIARSLEQLSSR